jgi:hypothetical protein
MQEIKYTEQDMKISRLEVVTESIMETLKKLDNDIKHQFNWTLLFMGVILAGIIGILIK